MYELIKMKEYFDIPGINVNQRVNIQFFYNGVKHIRLKVEFSGVYLGLAGELYFVVRC